MEFINFMDQNFDAKLEKVMKDEPMKDMKDNMEDMKDMKDMHEMHEMHHDNAIDSVRPLAIAYVPMQKWGNIYDPDKGIKRGTMFPDLDFPFLGREMSSK